MSWEEEALRLYERNRSEIGIIKKYGNVFCVLLPLHHTTVTAQIEIVIDGEGNFLDASRVSDENKLTIIPITEKSGSRTAGKAPHPLCDNLQYLAGDYGLYVKGKSDSAAECYQMYMEALENWYLSQYTHEKVKAIYHYVKKKEVMQDLINSGVLVLDDDNFLDQSFKIQSVTQDKSFVRFVVRQKVTKEVLEEKCWQDRTLQENFIQYVRSLQIEKTLDYLTGKQESPSYLHAKKIRNEGDGAKLISSNDEINFTFRGRFEGKEQAFAIGNENSQRIHNALKWIIRKQGRSFDTLTIVAWESDGIEMPSWDADTETISSGSEDAKNFDFKAEDMEEENPFEDDFLGESDEEKQETVVSDTNVITAEQFYCALDGYRKEINFTSKMVLVAFDAATSGRLALAEYKTLDSARYLENIEKWHNECQWLQEKYKNGKKIGYYGVPGTREIAEILYGSDSKGILTIPDKNRKRLYAEISKRLIPCIWNGRILPQDLMMQAVKQASSPQSYKERRNWEKVLALACSFVKKCRYDRKKEEFNVALNKECDDRNYLYGRLLAVADRIEYKIFIKNGENGRVTNAKRYMSAFSQRPFTTWKIIEENIQPYLSKMDVKNRRYYENLIDEICSLFDIEKFQDNTKLDGLYLLGFHSQSLALRNSKNEETKIAEAE